MSASKTLAMREIQRKSGQKAAEVTQALRITQKHAARMLTEPLPGVADAGAEMMVLPFPPSMNHYWRNVGGKVLISREGREYRQAVADLAMAEKWPRYGQQRVSVHIEAWMPDGRRRDLDNLLKSLLDSLTHAGVWEDDSQIDGLAIWRAPLIGGMCKVEVRAA